MYAMCKVLCPRLLIFRGLGTILFKHVASGLHELLKAWRYCWVKMDTELWVVECKLFSCHHRHCLEVHVTSQSDSFRISSFIYRTSVYRLFYDLVIATSLLQLSCFS